MTGLSLSTTVIVNVQVSALPLLSVAMYSTVVVPTGKMSPLLWLPVNVTLQLSLAVGAVQVTVASQTPGVLFTVMSWGQLLMTGG